MGDSAILHSDLDALIGAVLHDRYRVESLLGAGGMGAVFKAHHTGLNRDVALKVLHPEIARDRAVGKRFEREATSASRLDHPNCVRVMDFGTTEAGITYLVMEMLAGSELEARLGQPWTADATIDTAKQILAGLEHAHHFGIVHRDLKPENVYITKDFRGDELVKLVDFGIAKLLDEQGSEKLTRQGVVFGTPRYMSPEQAAGGKIDERTDLYAAGLIMYEMLAGRPPFDADDAATLLRMHIMAPPPALPSDVPASLAKVVEKLLEKSKGDRYASAREVITALEEAQAGLAAGGLVAGGVAAAAAAGAAAAGAAGAASSAGGSSSQATAALEASASNSTRPLAAAGPITAAQAARSGVAWQPSAAAAASASTSGNQTHAYIPGTSTGSHMGVGELSTGSFDALPIAGASAGASAATSRATWTDSHPVVPQQPLEERTTTTPVVVAHVEDEERRRSPLLWLAIAAVALCGLAGVAFALTQSSGDGDADGEGQTEGEQVESASTDAAAGAIDQAQPDQSDQNNQAPDPQPSDTAPSKANTDTQKRPARVAPKEADASGGGSKSIWSVIDGEQPSDGSSSSKPKPAPAPAPAPSDGSSTAESDAEQLARREAEQAKQDTKKEDTKGKGKKPHGKDKTK